MSGQNRRMELSTSEPIDYLVIGHITQDLLDDGTYRPGGTVSYSGLTAKALGRRVGILTSCAADTDLDAYAGIQVRTLPAAQSTVFRNIPTDSGRLQYMYHSARRLDASSVPEEWKNSPIVHLGPVAAEIDPDIYTAFPRSLLCLTPQGWLRSFAQDGRVFPVDWTYSPKLLQAAHAVVLSLEDLRNDEKKVEKWASMCHLLAVTESDQGARVYWNGDVRRFPAPKVALAEDTGAGDIFAACFFHRLYSTQDPWEAARFAVRLAAASVTRRHFHSTPTSVEISAALTQII
ncbi:MAG TPA: PfkB family carbohydrate kinase [Anaerolineaceae bacterium]|nr:PfkB family carbohydrate kinase [Anaerolineaceae bacterium]